MAYRFAVVTTKTDPINAATLSIGLLALLQTIPDDTGKENVHRLRTTVRRLEVQLGECLAKIAKCLKRLRKKAGRMRDIDVHLALLKKPLITKRSSHRDNGSCFHDNAVQDELREIFKTERDRQVDSLRKLVAETAPRMKSKLPLLVERASQRNPSADQAHRTAERVRRRFLQWTRVIPEDPERLHRLRISTKNLRYSLEPLDQFDECAELAAKMKQVQDAIGNWHDWATLQQIAERELKSPDALPVCAALEARTGREYRKARRTCESVRIWISGSGPAKLAATGEQSLRLIRKAG
jgi:CHAD domain-containing protein